MQMKSLNWKKHSKVLYVAARFASKVKVKLRTSSVHDGVKKYQCTKCEACFKQKPNLKRHFTLHHEGKKPFVCNICKKGLTSKSSLRYHLTNVHDKILTIIVSKKSFLYVYQLNKQKKFVLII